MNNEATVQALRRLRKMFPDETCRVFTETWIDPDNSSEIRHGVTIKTDWPGKVLATGATLEEAMAQICNPHEDQTCAECKYGAVDSAGLCVIDASHKAVEVRP